MIVVDVGCHPHGNEESVYKLVDRFKPEILFGFDPYHDLSDGIETVHSAGIAAGLKFGCTASTRIVRRRVAAWTRAERLPFRVESHEGVLGIASGITTPGDPDSVTVDAIDLGSFLTALPADDGLVLKLDCEGAEYPILRDLADRRIDARLSIVLVEWHPEEMAHGLFAERPELRCPVEDWA